MESHPGVTEDQSVQIVWHPAIEAVFWVGRWVIVAGLTAIVWEFAVNRLLRADRVLARGVVVALVLASLTLVAILLDLFGSIAQHAWVNYSGRVAKTIFAVAIIVFLTITTPYVWFVVYLLRREWPHILRWFGDSQFLIATDTAVSPGLTAWVLLIGTSGALLWLTYFVWRRNPLYSYRHSIDVLGLQKCIAGVCLMAYLRLLVPRRDFFLDAPVVSWIQGLGIAILVHQVIPIGMFAISIPVLIVIIMIPRWADSLAPPLWIFLGTSEFNAFRMFYGLRATWRRHGLTLLDRTSAGGRQFYDTWSWRLRGWFYNPGTARIWSLRTRPQMWFTALRFLTAFVPVIVVDWRRPSKIVESEVEWLASRGFMDKVYMVVSPEAAGTTDGSIAGAKMVVEEALMTSQWAGGRLLIQPPAAENP
ncbi:MAG: hypothetical protein C5B51_12800 [Terriglobia bacterium]|nr:MAG: hypothetical protein C5B51_12800 [Terriglobia bacterium]